MHSKLVADEYLLADAKVLSSVGRPAVLDGRRWGVLQARGQARMPL